MPEASAHTGPLQLANIALHGKSPLLTSLPLPDLLLAQSPTPVPCISLSSQQDGWHQQWQLVWPQDSSTQAQAWPNSSRRLDLEGGLISWLSH